MKINVTDTGVALQSGEETFSLLQKPIIPDYSNVTARPYLSSYHVISATVWDCFCLCMENLHASCPDDPYLGCYALMFGRLYTLLLSSSQAKNVIAYGPPTDCGAYKIFQDFMTFLQEGNALTALAQSPFAFTSLTNSSCSALLYRLDTCPVMAAVCDAMEKVKPGGLILLYTLQGTPPAELGLLCEKAEKDSFGSCTVYALTMDESLSAFVHANSSENFLFSRAEEVLKRASDVQNLIQAMLAGASLPEDAYSIAVLVLQQSEELLLSIYDYLEDDELPIRTNALKEAVLNYYVGVRGKFDLTTYKEKLTQASEVFFAGIEREFQ